MPLNVVMLSDKHARRDPVSVCELCWRPSAHSQMSDQIGQSLSMARRFSDRFCLIHTPGEPASEYKTGVSYQGLYEHELSVNFSHRRSAYAIKFEPPGKTTFLNTTKAAYDLVRVFPRRDPNSINPEFSWYERVWLLHQQGVRQVDIARKLGIRRQAVGKHIKKWIRLYRLIRMKHTYFWIPLSRFLLKIKVQGYCSQTLRN